MKYCKRLDVYKASNVCLDQNRDAYSYGWWKFYDAESGVFNNSFYSQSTCKHQSKVRKVLQDLGIQVSLVLRHTKANLTNVPDAIESEIDAVKEHKYEILAKLDKLKNQDGVRGQQYKHDILCTNERLKQLEFHLKRVSNFNTI